MHSHRWRSAISTGPVVQPSQCTRLHVRQALRSNPRMTVHPPSSTSDSTAVKVTADGNFAAMCTLMGGFDDSCFRGYVGTWTSFDHLHPDSSRGADTQTPPAAATPAAAAPAAATASAAAAAAGVTTVFDEETVNFRLFRMDDPATHKIHQVNMYQGGGRPAAASYKAYLSSDAAPWRPDGYGLREWKHDPSGALWNPDGSAWQADPTVAERTLLGLAVEDCGLALINGALPSSFDPQHTPSSWWMEAIFKQPGCHARRWGMLHRYDSGRLANSKAMNEDLTEFKTEELHSCTIDPAAIKWQDRKQGSLGDLDALFASTQQQQQQQEGSSVQLRFSPQGRATTFTYDAQQQLSMQTGPCEWNSCHETSMVQVDLPDWTYSRLPADMTVLVTGAAGDKPQAAAAAAATSDAGAGVGDAGADVVFELGTVLSNGSLARWLLCYDAAGGRLLKRAVYELYPAA